MSADGDDPASMRRVVLLGASNLAIGLRTVIAAAQSAWGQPLEILAALGHGRGYGTESRVLGRVLPPILNCGIWQELEARPEAETTCLMTDIGNDLVFGATAAQVEQWVREAASRLRPHSPQITFTQLPLCSLRNVGPWRFRFMRSLLFPSSSLTREDALRQAEEVNRTLVQLAGELDAKLVTPLAEWYGFDPIHIRRASRSTAWQNIFSAAAHTSHSAPYTPIADSWLRVHRLRPLQRKLFGIKQHQRQPAGVLADGSTISLY